MITVIRRRAAAILAFFIALAAVAANMAGVNEHGLFGIASAGILAGYAWAEFRRPTGAFADLRG